MTTRTFTFQVMGYNLILHASGCRQNQLNGEKKDAPVYVCVCLSVCVARRSLSGQLVIDNPLISHSTYGTITLFPSLFFPSRSLQNIFLFLLIYAKLCLCVYMCV